MSNVAGKAYAMNVVTPMRPAKTWVNRLIFMMARVMPTTLAGLLGLSLIHFARWVIIGRDQWPRLGQPEGAIRNDYMLFISNFNGTWDQYIDAFSDGLPNGLDLFWYSSTKYPHSIPITAFKNYIRANQVDTDYYYNATPDAAQRDIKAASRVRAAMRTLAEAHRTSTAEAFAPLYVAALASVQNDLGSLGLAPVASNDTAEADKHRRPYVEARWPPKGGANANRDGGHYFLTALFPIRSDAVRRDDGSVTAPSHGLREALASLPTAAQSATSITSDRVSPFARCTRTHFARLFVLDQPSFNGRDPTDALIGNLKMYDLLAHQPVDCLGCPWLVLIVDFDERLEEADGGLDTYRRGLWEKMEPELRAIFGYCHGFDQVGSAGDFAAYVRTCQIETTMPFNDYWTGAPPLKSISLGQFGAILAGLVAAIVVAEIVLLRLAHIGLGWLWLGVPIAVVFAVLILKRFVESRSALPFPTAPNSDLPSVLKALHVQQAFARFAAAHQFDDSATLHAAFADFVTTERPDDVAAPTRLPGRVAA